MASSYWGANVEVGDDAREKFLKHAFRLQENRLFEYQSTSCLRYR